MKNATFTKGKGMLAPVYERLRKRSWRRFDRRWNAWAAPPILVRTEHEYYVSGVRDALAEIDRAFVVIPRVRSAGTPPGE